MREIITAVRSQYIFIYIVAQGQKVILCCSPHQRCCLTAFRVYRTFTASEAKCASPEETLKFYLEPLRYPSGEKAKARTWSASHEGISALFLRLYQSVRGAPWWGVKLRSEESPSLWEKLRSNTQPSLVALRGPNSAERRKMVWQKIDPALCFW